MSTALTIADADRFALLADTEQTQGIIDTVQGMGGFNALMQYRLKLPSGGGKFFTIDTIEGEQAVATFEAVILCVIPNQRQWHRESMEDSGGGAAPDCASVNGVDGWGRREVDGSDAMEPASAQSCATCPWNQWGSARKGGRGKDCKESAVLWFLRPDRGLPECMSVPATSLKVLSTYQVKLMGARVNPYQALTTFGLEVVKSDGGIAYAKLTLKHTGSVAEEVQVGALMMAKAIKEQMASRTPFVNEPSLSE